MTKNILSKDAIEKSFKINETAGRIYEKYVKSRDESQKQIVLKSIMEFADVSTTDFQVRAKALAILWFLKISYTEGDTSIYYKDFDVIKYGTDIPKIIENNCNWISNALIKPGITIEENGNFYNIIVQTNSCIEDFNIRSKTTEKYLSFLFKHLKLDKKNASNQLTERENYLYKQILRIKKGVFS